MFFPVMAQMMVRRQAEPWAEPWDGVVQLSALVVPTVGAGGLGLIAVDSVSTDTVQSSALVIPTVSVNTSVDGE
jgi:hypothetical protein